MVRVPALLAVLAAVAPLCRAPAAAGDHPPASGYRAPVDAPVVDTFRPPPTPYSAGNRGIDYATAPGQPVAAAAPGEVTFAGPVGGGLHVVVLHDDGIRTSYSFLRRLLVRRGSAVGAGQPLGEAGGRLHFGARAGDDYLDPALLLASAHPPPGAARLVPEADRSPAGEEAERSALARGLPERPGPPEVAGSAAVGAGSAAVAWARRDEGAASGRAQLGGWLQQARTLRISWRWAAVGLARSWARDLERCTPAGVDPPRAAGRRLLVLVAGLGSGTGRAAVLDVDTGALGYAPVDVTQFSYRAGGSYGPADTQADMDMSARLLADQVRRLQAANSGVPVDVVAHSQGGLVTRAALAGGLGGVSTLVTLGTPHRGTDIATAGAMVGDTRTGAALLLAGGLLAPAGVDPRSPSVLQMAETSEFIRRLAASGLPAGARVCSVAARYDAVVPSPRSYVAGAENVTVTVSEVPSLADHGRLPGSDPARREIALALAGMAPTCETWPDRLADHLAGHAAALAADLAGAALVAGGRALDGSLGRPLRRATAAIPV